MLTRKWAYRQPVFLSGGHQVNVKRAVKYLGITLDSKLTFTTHLRMASALANNTAKAIGRLMPNVGGPSMAKRLLLASVVSAKLLYAAPVWVERAVKFDVNRKALDRSLRLAAIRVTRCYRTVSTAAALVLAGLPPGDLLAQERLSMRRWRMANPDQGQTPLNRNIREVTLQEWQSRWTAETEVASWTRRVLPSVIR